MANTSNQKIDSIKIHSYSDIIFFWPLEILTLVFLICTIIPMLQTPDLIRIFSWIWVIIFVMNLFIVAFDFSSGKTFLIVAILIVVILILIILSIFANFNILQDILLFIQIPIDFYWTFYAVMALIFGVLFLIAFLAARINYLEVTSNQIFYKQGIMGERINLSTERVQLGKIINDVFEYLIFKSGDLILSSPTSGKYQTLTLQNVININKKIDIINHIIAKTEVDIF
ncbi:MAG: hypothetical protein EAX96_00600 [Candidatus Lokiarchaeota archaeon]|nr:hypothetical protein [Candidatus Lokiarchaeota archaeon]